MRTREMVASGGEVRRELARAALVAAVTAIATTATTFAIDAVKAALARKKNGGTDASQ